MCGIALGEVDAKRLQLTAYGFVFDKLGNRLHPHYMADFVDGLDHRAVDGINGHVPNEQTVCFEKVPVEILEVREG